MACRLFAGNDSIRLMAHIWVTRPQWVKDIAQGTEQLMVYVIMMTSSNGNIFRKPVLGEFPAQRPVTRSFDVFFDLRLNKRLI